jgi:Tol biopolymer transport system component
MQAWQLVGVCALALVAGVDGAVPSLAATGAPDKGYSYLSVQDNGRGVRTLSVLPPALFGPDGTGRVIARSGDGKLILIATAGETVVARADGSNAVTLRQRGQQGSHIDAATASFSPDRRHVAFSDTDCPGSFGSESCFNLYVAATGGSDVRLLAPRARSSAWSADGKWIAYYGGLVGLDVAPAALYVSHPDGSSRRRIARDAVAFSVSFAPTGKRLAYQCTTDHGSGVCVINADGSGKRLVNRGGASSLLWSPDGSKIAISQAAGGVNHSQLALVTVATRRTRWLTHSNINGDVDVPLAWSPDSSKIAFQRTCVYGPPLCRIAVYAIDVDTGGKRRLSNDDRQWVGVRWVGHRLSYLAPTA